VVAEADDTPQYLALVQVVRRIQPRLDEVKPRVVTALQHDKLSAVLSTQKKQTKIIVDVAYFESTQ